MEDALWTGKKPTASLDNPAQQLYSIADYDRKLRAEPEIGPTTNRERTGIQISVFELLQIAAVIVKHGSSDKEVAPQPR